MTQIEGGLRLKGQKKHSSRNEPLISVLIVTYNAHEFLQECIESVFDQTYKNIELIIVDGASTDGTQEVLESFDNKIDYWVSEPDTGQSNAFNKGFRLCSGELLTWLNADEVYAKTALEAVAKKFNQNRSISWLSAGVVFTDKDLNIIKMRKGEGGQKFLKNIGILNVYGSSTFFTKELFFRAGGMNESLHYTMDTDLWWRFLKLGEEFRRVDCYVCLYRIHEKSKTGSYTLEGNLRKPDHQAEIDRIAELYQNNDVTLGVGLSKIARNICRLFSIAYVSSIYDSLRYKGMNAKRLFD